MTRTSFISIKCFDKTELKHARVYSGISPKAMRRVFATWAIFCVIVAIIVALAPDLSQTFELTVFGILIAFTVAMFAQSRIAEGWPAIIALDHEICVVREPQDREFICVPPELIVDVVPTLIKPNKKAVALVLDQAQLTDGEKKLLNQAVWPREDRLLALAQFISRQKACEKIKTALY